MQASLYILSAQVTWHYKFFNICQNFLILFFTIKTFSPEIWFLGSIFLCIKMRNLIREDLTYHANIHLTIDLSLSFFLSGLFMVSFKKDLGFSMLWTKSILFFLASFLYIERIDVFDNKERR